jgi:hypothetical protein
VHWAEIALGPDAQCGCGPRLRRQLGPRAQRVRGPRPRGRTAHGHTARPALTGLASTRRVRAAALPGGARLGGGSAAAHGRRRGRRLTGAEMATGDGDGRRRARDGDGRRCRKQREVRGNGRRAGGCGGAAVGRARERGSCRDAQRAVPKAALSRCVGVVHGGHTAVARCRSGLARRAAADRWCPLVSDFRIKKLPRMKLAQNK